MGLDQLSASSDFLPDSFYMRSTIEREINYQVSNLAKNGEEFHVKKGGGNRFFQIQMCKN